MPVELDDLVGVARATDDPMIITVRGDSEFKSLDDLLQASRKTEGGLKWGTTFVGGADHVAIHRFAKAADDLPYTVVPFKGGGAIVTSMMGGDLDIALLNYAEGETQYTAGEARALVVLANDRLPTLPDVPTAKEAGVDVTAFTVRGFRGAEGGTRRQARNLTQRFR